MLSGLRAIEAEADETLGIELSGLEMLDVGAGQLFLQASYFSLRNSVVGIDLDVIAHGFDLGSYLGVLRENGSKRFAKTAGRKLMLVDSRYRREMTRQLGVERLPVPELRQMDAANMAFPDGSFDFVYSIVVFQHLPDPGAVLAEMLRVLRPGGGVYVEVTLFTSPTGSLDVRALAGGRHDLQSWAHLQPSTGEEVRPNAYVSRFRLDDWRDLFERWMPGVTIRPVPQSDAERFEQEARSAWSRGQLTDYTLEDLLTNKIVVLWRKPERADNGH
jgi:SAM-dependent methyltransferase